MIVLGELLVVDLEVNVGVKEERQRRARTVKRAVSLIFQSVFWR